MSLNNHDHRSLIEREEDRRAVGRGGSRATNSPTPPAPGLPEGRD